MSSTMADLAKRVYIPTTPSSLPGQIEANTVDPWINAGQYALGWTYFCVVIVFLVSATRVYHWWTDKMRQALYKTEVQKNMMAYSPESEYAMSNMTSSNTADQFFQHEIEKQHRPEYQSAASSINFINDTLALFRWIFYRPIPEINYYKKKRIRRWWSVTRKTS